MRRIFIKKKTVAAGLAVSIAVSVLTSGCVRQMPEQPAEDDRLKIVCTIFPEYDWVKQVLGERADQAELTLLLKNGADLHSYQPTVWDIQKIAEADLFVYVGGESDLWVETVLQNTENPDRKTLNLMEILAESVKEEESVEGMQEGRGQGHPEKDAEGADVPETDERAEEDHHGETEYDEHIWLSLKNAQKVCEAVAETLCEMDKAHAASYRESAMDYQAKLRELDMEYAAVAEQAQKPVLLFGDRFPFRYLTEDYGIAYYAAFAGCSAETEASFSTITFLAKKAGELGLPAVLAIDGSDRKVARTIAGNTRTKDQKVLILDSMQSVSGKDIENGESYLSIMERNLEVLKEALAVRGGE